MVKATLNNSAVSHLDKKKREKYEDPCLTLSIGLLSILSKVNRPNTER